jgi:protease-4
MNELKRPGPVRHVLGTLWNGITRVRVALSNILFLLIVLLIFMAFRDKAPEPLPDRTALLLNPRGMVVDQRSYVDPLALFLDEQAPQEHEVLLDDILDAILLAKDDPKITALVMQLDQLFGIGTSKTGEVAEAIAEFRASGKPVIAWADSFSQGQYLLAAEADELIIHPMGGVVLEGFANYQWYFAEALEKLAVNVHVFKAGEFKAIAEPFQRSDMSEGQKEISRRWLNGAWSYYTARIEERRKLPTGAVNSYVDRFPDTVQENGGDLAITALESGLVDRVMVHSDANDYIAGVVGARNDDGLYEAVEFERYVKRRRPVLNPLGGGNQVAVITGRGSISSGEQPAGTIGADTLGPLIEGAADDPDVAAIVLRLDSGGGGTFASEVVRQSVLEARESGKPLVVSMGSIATSGAYWIASAADEIWATPTTLTGSIGVFLAVPTFEGLLDKAGISTDGVGSTDVAGAFRLDRALSPAAMQTYQAGVNHFHEMFIDIISEGRGMPEEKVRSLADGGVYLGSAALELGLVDNVGSRRAAIEAAARLAGLAEDEYTPVLYEEALSPRERFLRQLAGEAQGLLGGAPASWESRLQSFSMPLRAGLRVLENLEDPRNIYAHCMVCIAP